MTATAVYNDHFTLENIGTKTHAEIEGHIQGISNYAFPAADGNADQLLKTSGAGVLSWIDQPAGFACGSLNPCNLTDIGTRAHASLTGIGASDHHVKYTDAEAVAAADASDKFIERNVVNNISTSPTTLRGTIGGTMLRFLLEKSGSFFTTTLMDATVKSTSTTYTNMWAYVQFPIVYVGGTDGSMIMGSFLFQKAGGQRTSSLLIKVSNMGGHTTEAMELFYDKIDIKNLPIKDIKNHVHSALSGTKKLVEILIGTTPYYFEVYPTKA